MSQRGSISQLGSLTDESAARRLPCRRSGSVRTGIPTQRRIGRQVHLAHTPHELSVRQDVYVGLVELSRAMNHVFIRESGVVGDNPGHSKSRGGTAHCQVATDPVRQCKEVRRILRALTCTGCHIERIGRLDEKIHARVVRSSHWSVPNTLRWQARQAHHLALEPIGTLDLVTVSRDAGALNDPLRGYTRRRRSRTPGLGPGGVPHGEPSCDSLRTLSVPMRKELSLGQFAEWLVTFRPRIRIE